MRKLSYATAGVETPHLSHERGGGDDEILHLWRSFNIADNGALCEVPGFLRFPLFKQALYKPAEIRVDDIIQEPEQGGLFLQLQFCQTRA